MITTLPQKITHKGIRFDLKHIVDDHFTNPSPIHFLLYVKFNDTYYEHFHIEAHGPDLTEVQRELLRKINSVHPVI